MLEELHVHKVECMYHMYVLGITGDCDGHAVASEANWKWGGLDISENFQQGKNRGDGYGYVLLCKKKWGGGGIPTPLMTHYSIELSWNTPLPSFSVHVYVRVNL